VERTLTIVNKKGLHARAAAKFAGLAGGFSSAIDVSRGGQTVTATSIMGLMMLAAAPGCEIVVSAEGADAEAALDAVEALVANRFDEDE
jgi:phosphocarrier protein HPr